MDFFIQQCQAVIETQSGLFLSLFLGGLLGSVSHCTGMCGPIVMAQCSKQQARITSDTGLSLQTAAAGALLPYHMGRTITYILLGILGASMSQYLIGTPAQTTVAAILLVTAGLLFVAKAAPSIIAVSTGSALTPVTRTYGRLVGSVAAPFGASSSRTGLFFFGTMLGFLPCGLVLAAVMAVTSTGDPLTAIFGMAAFSLGTVPSLVLLGIGAAGLRRRWPAEVDKFAKTIMALNGLILCAVGLRLAF